MYLVMAEIFVA